MTKQDKIKKVMDEFKNGTLKTPDGKVVKSRKQALAIAMSESEDYAEKGDLINHLSVNSTADALDILKSAGGEDIFEKAKHQDGDMHPNGKWVWVASANGGRGDWRTHGGRAHSKAGASVGGATVKTQPKKSPTPKTEKEEREKTKQKKLRPVGTGTNGPERRMKKEQEKINKKNNKSTSKVDISKIPDKEFRRIKQILEKFNPEAPRAESYLVPEEMTDKQLANFSACAKHFMNDKQHINLSTRYNCRKWAELAEDEIENRKK